MSDPQRPRITAEEFFADLRHQVDGAEQHVRNLRAEDPARFPDVDGGAWLAFFLGDVELASAFIGVMHAAEIGRLALVDERSPSFRKAREARAAIVDAAVELEQHLDNASLLKLLNAVRAWRSAQ